MSDAPQLPAPAPAEPPFRSRETRLPELGPSIEEALAKLQRRRAERAAAAGTGPAGEPAPPAPAGEWRPQPTPLQPPAAPAADRPAALPPPDARMPYPELPPAHGGPPGGGVAVPDDAGSLVVQIDVDGQLMSVTVDELRRGYLREIDYRRKSQAAAAELRRAQEANQQLAVARTALEQRLPAYVAQHQQEFSQPIDWDKLSREDPIGSVQKMARLLMAQQAQAEAMQLAQARAGEEHQRKQQLMAAGHEVLCRAIPGWAEPATRQVIQQAIAQHAIALGYPADMVARAEVLDPREIIMAYKSMNYDRLMAQRVQPEPVGARTVNGNGANRRQPQAAALSELEDRFRQSRNLEDAVAFATARRMANQRPDMPQLGRLRG